MFKKNQTTLIMIFSGLAALILNASPSLAAFNGGAPDVDSSTPTRVFNCRFEEGDAKMTAQLLLWENDSSLRFAQMNVTVETPAFDRRRPNEIAHWSETIPGPLRQTSVGQTGVKKGSVPIFDRATLKELSFPDLRGRDIRTLPNTMRLIYSSISGPVGQTGHNVENAICTSI